jgi:hypothetical protein
MIQRRHLLSKPGLVAAGAGAGVVWTALAYGGVVWSNHTESTTPPGAHRTVDAVGPATPAKPGRAGMTGMPQACRIPPSRTGVRFDRYELAPSRCSF